MFLAFGEIMMRICPEQHLRLQQAIPGRVEVTFGGGEANVAVSLALLGSSVRYVTALPRHAISESVVRSLRSFGIDTEQILWREDGRLGIYFVEKGANQRGSTVLYDRQDSAVSLAEADEYNFAGALKDIHHVHITGITPAISENGFFSTLELVRQAKQKGAQVSCDLNFRKKLWNWQPGTSRKDLARECMTKILKYVDLVIGNEEDAADVLGVYAEGTNVSLGTINNRAYEEVARKIAAQFPHLSKVAITLRQSVSADHNNWGAILFDAKENTTFFAPLTEKSKYEPYKIHDIVDRVGAGDSFGAGLLCALYDDEYNSPDKAIQFAVAASCLKHSIQGDFNHITKKEVIALMHGNQTGRVQR